MATAKKAPAKKAVVEEAVPLEAAVIPPPPGTPPPITPATKGSAKTDRILYENAINQGAEEFALQAKLAYIDAAVAGGSVELVTTLPDEE